MTQNNDSLFPSVQYKLLWATCAQPVALVLALDTAGQDASAPAAGARPVPGPGPLRPGPLRGAAARPCREDDCPGEQDESTRGGEQVSQVLTAIHKRQLVYLPG